MNNKISAGQIETASGPFFKTTPVPAGDAIRHPNRMFIGEGYAHSQNTNGSVTGGSWLQSFTAGGSVTPVTGWDYFEDVARQSVVSSYGLALVGASRTYGGTLDAIGVTAAALNDRNGNTQAWGAYIDAVKSHVNAGTTVGAEIEIANLPSTSPLGGVNPYNTFVDGMTRGLAIGGGSDSVVFGRSYAVDAAQTINNNGAAFWAGLVFRHNALMREGLADDRSIPSSSGYARAISMAHDHGISWYSRDPIGAPGTQAEVVRMFSTVDSPSVLWGVAFRDSAIDFHERVGPGNSLFVIDYEPDSADYLGIKPGIAGAGVRIQARGSANAGIAIEPNGTGNVYIPIASVPNYADDVAAAAGGLSVGAIYRTGSLLKIRAV